MTIFMDFQSLIDWNIQENSEIFGYCMRILALYSSSGVIAVVAGLHNPINTTFVRTPHLENGEGPIKNYCFK